MLIMATLPSTLILYLWAVLVWQRLEPALFEWDVFEMAAPIQSSAKCEVRYVIWFLNSEGEHGIYWTIYSTVQTSCPAISTCFFTQRNISLGKSSTTMMRCKKMSWRGSKGRWQTSMTQGYRSWFQDLINVWTMPATMLKNKVMCRQIIHSVAFLN